MGLYVPGRGAARIATNGGDALTAAPIRVALFLRSIRGEKLAGLSRAAIFVSAYVGAYGDATPAGARNGVASVRRQHQIACVPASSEGEIAPNSLAGRGGG